MKVKSERHVHVPPAGGQRSVGPHLVQKYIQKHVTVGSGVTYGIGACHAVMGHALTRRLVTAVLLFFGGGLVGKQRLQHG